MQRSAHTRHAPSILEALTASLSDHHWRALDGLLTLREDTKGSGLVLAARPAARPAEAQACAGRTWQRLKTRPRALACPDGLEHVIHQNRLLKLAREGGQMTAQHCASWSPPPYATLVAVVLEPGHRDRRDRRSPRPHPGHVFSRAKRTHEQQFQQSGKAINDKVRLFSRVGQALLGGQEAGTIPLRPSRPSAVGRVHARA